MGVNLIPNPAHLAVQIVKQEGGQFERNKLLLAMIIYLPTDGASQLAEEGIKQAIDDKHLHYIGGDQLAI